MTSPQLETRDVVDEVLRMWRSRELKNGELAASGDVWEDFPENGATVRGLLSFPKGEKLDARGGKQGEFLKG